MPENVETRGFGCSHSLDVPCRSSRSPLPLRFRERRDAFDTTEVQLSSIFKMLFCHDSILVLMF